MYGEDGEAEYGGSVMQPRPSREITDHDHQYFSGRGPSFWEAHGIPRRELERFQAPLIGAIRANETQIHFFGYYKRWTPQENYYFCVANTGFAPNDSRTEGTYSKYASLDDKLDGLHYYLSFIKFGIGRATSDAAHEIRDGHITREEGVALVHRFDGEFPRKYWADCLDYMQLREGDAMAIIARWKCAKVWDGDTLRYQVS
jgi:hypothetical protein